jgi:polysaccharide export outer membrane protein
MNCDLNQRSARTLPHPDTSGAYQVLARALNLNLFFWLGLLLLVAPGVLKADVPVTNHVVAATGVQPAGQPSVPGTTNQLNVLDDKYLLAIGDTLSFRIIEDEDDPKILTVTDSGDLEVPYIGRYPAVGKTCKQLAQELKQELEKEYYLQATVVIAVDSKPRSRGKIYIVGAINSPGPQDISGAEALTVSKAILRAGGLTTFANGKQVRVTRSTGTHPGDEKTFTINVTEIYEQGKTENDLTLQPGDLIYVPERMIRF